MVLWGSNPANNQPVFMKYLYLARRRGCRVVVVNPFLEPGLARYWVPSNVESALFGTKMCDLHVPVRPGGDVALANATLKLLHARGPVDRGFVDRHTAAGHHGRFYSPEELEAFFVLAGGKDPRVESVEICWTLPSARDAVLFFRSLFGLEPSATDREIETQLDGLGASATPAGFRIPWTMHYASAARP